jgi:hypothetical protein
VPALTQRYLPVENKAVDAIHDRSIGHRTHELPDPSFPRHGLARLFHDSHDPAGASKACRKQNQLICAALLG